MIASRTRIRRFRPLMQVSAVLALPCDGFVFLEGPARIDVFSQRKIPFLGDIPWLGNLFKYKYENRAKKNLVILVTARLINAEGNEIK